MNKQAFFFLGDNLLLPADFPDSRITMGLPLELAKNFKDTEVFEIPAIDDEPGTIHAVSVLPGTAPPEQALPENWRNIPVRQVLAILSVSETGGGNPCRILRAYHTAQWRLDSRFCGTCGARNNDVPGEAQRRCPKCGRIEFPRICPAVITAITDNENKILLAHNKRFKNRVYSHISGFNEAGETLEETVAREIFEEIKIKIKDIVYIKSQPWPFPNSLMIGFSARYLSGTIKPDGEEIEDAKWFTRDDLPELPGQGSLSRYLIGRWLDGTLRETI